MNLKTKHIFKYEIYLKIIILVIHTVFSAPYTAENSKWNINFNPDGNDPSKYFGKWEGHSYFPSPKDWRGESIYQFITDRFADGDPLNNEVKYGGYNLYDVGKRHGGDFKGVTKKLDYIKSLGYTSIWISPIFQNMENSYHGYAQIDFTLIDRRWGTLEEMREMINEAHKRDLKVIVDIVVNHMADLFYFDGYKDKAAPFRFHDGEYRLFWRDEKRIYEDFKIDNTFYKEGKYCDVYSSEGVKISDPGQGSFWMSDFHHNGDLRNYGETWENTFGKIYGLMDDLRTSHPRVQDKLIAMTQALIASTDIDGIRMDTPMQVPLYFFKRWVPSVKNFAKSLGKNNFLMFAEFYCSKEKASTMTGRGKTPDMFGKNQFIDDTFTFDGGIHYPLFYWFNTAVKDQQNNLRGILDLFNWDKYDYDWFNPYTGQMEYRHLNFYDNHDQWRLSASPYGFQKVDLSSAIIAFWPGIPLFYYGDEQGFLTHNTALDGWSREDFMTSLAWKNLPTVDGKNPAEGDNFDMTNRHYLWVQKIMNIRKNYENLKYCDDVTERWVQTQNTNGIFAFSRTCNSPSEWVLVMFNTWKDKLSVDSMTTGWRSGDIIVNAIDEKESYILKEYGKTGIIFLSGFEVKVFVLKSNLKSLDLSIYSIFPPHDKSVIRSPASRTLQITIEFSQALDKDSLKNRVKFNNEILPFEMFNMPSDFVLKLTVVPKDGVNYIEIDQSVRSKFNGKNLSGKFTSRFRYGDSNNIIVNRDITSDQNLLRGITSEKLELSHSAAGAEFLRVLFKTSNAEISERWTEWINYKSMTEHKIPEGINLNDLVEIQAQYYVDNSAAYLVRASFDKSLKFLLG